jgi:phosphoribosylamine--glycine ligase
VIEFNARFGDPETEVVLPRLESDLFAIFTDVLAGVEPLISWSDDNVLGVILASKGYPDDYETGYEISGFEKLEPETMIFHCGTGGCAEKPVTSGGRVLLAARKARDMKTARAYLYSDIKKIKCANLFYRRDIGSECN